MAQTATVSIRALFPTAGKTVLPPPEMGMDENEGLFAPTGVGQWTTDRVLPGA
jgi:hypothetical protein